MNVTRALAKEFRPIRSGHHENVRFDIQRTGEPTGKWYAVLGVEIPDDPPEKPENPEKCIGIDVGILKYAHDTDGTAVDSLDLSNDRERLERAQSDLSRKEHGSANWEKQRRVVAERHAELKNKRRDFLHKLSNYYAREYDLVAVEDLDAAGLVETAGQLTEPGRSGVGDVSPDAQIQMRARRHALRRRRLGRNDQGMRVLLSTDKPLWVREHSCPACGFEANRDANAAWNILSRGIMKRLGAGRSESTPVETALPTDTNSVSAKRVVEAGSPTLKE